jgi:hypothetical protein
LKLLHKNSNSVSEKAYSLRDLRVKAKKTFEMCRKSYKMTTNPLKTIEMLTCTSNIAKNLMMDLLDLA